MQTQRTKSYMVAALLIALLLSGCVKQGTVLHPGQLNNFDGQAYDTIITLRGAMQQASVEVLNYPMYKDQVNQAIIAFNALQGSYITYHKAAAAGTATPAQQAAITQGIANLTATIAKLETAFGVKIQ